MEYRLHEFGLLAPSHSFAHWPGFSLNPALWDLARLDGSYRQKYGRKLEFNPADIRSALFIQPPRASGCFFLTTRQINDVLLVPRVLGARRSSEVIVHPLSP